MEQAKIREKRQISKSRFQILSNILIHPVVAPYLISTALECVLVSPYLRTNVAFLRSLLLFLSHQHSASLVILGTLLKIIILLSSRTLSIFIIITIK